MDKAKILLVIIFLLVLILNLINLFNGDSILVCMLILWYMNVYFNTFKSKFSFIIVLLLILLYFFIHFINYGLIQKEKVVLLTYIFLSIGTIQQFFELIKERGLHEKNTKEGSSFGKRKIGYKNR